MSFSRVLALARALTSQILFPKFGDREPNRRHTKATGLWTLYWRDHNLKYHRYQPLDPSPRIQDILDYLDRRADPIFWG
jgi:Protein of unknown function (DUF3024)